MIDWPELLRQHHIEFAEGGGRNVSRGYIAVRCPFCGPADESQHMSINLKRGSWRCWRNSAHRGGDPVWLLTALLRIPPTQARSLLGPDYVVMPSNLASAVRAKLEPAEPEEAAALALPEEFRPLKSEPPARRFLAYMRHRRGFDLPAIVARRYGLYYCTHGEWADRILFPIFERERLVAWTGRSILEQPRLRYKTEGPIGNHLLWFDELKIANHHHTILLCEGPFDALKVRALGEQLGITATCWFTSQPNRRQTDLLYELLPRFRRRLLVLDADAGGRAIELAQALQRFEVRRITLPARFEDPGELNKRGLLGLVEEAKMR
jgi:hypothetical protein